MFSGPVFERFHFADVCSWAYGKRFVCLCFEGAITLVTCI